MLEMILAAVLASNMNGSWQGNWLQPCSQSATHEERFRDDHVSLFETNYADAGCTAANLQIENAGSYITDTDLVLAGQRSIDFRFESVRMTVLSPLYLSIFQSRSICGVKDWKLGQPQDVTGRVCELYAPGIWTAIPSAGDLRYGIFKFEGTQLWFGKLTPIQNGLTPETRPVDWDLSPYQRLKNTFL